MLEIYCDGGNSAKNKVGGCSAIIIRNSEIMAELSEAYAGAHATNNAMELAGAILGLTYVLNHPELGKDVTLISDSLYIVDGGSKWLPRWKLKGWKTVTGKVKNQTLWEAIDYLKTQLNITFKWTKGHADNVLNNLADSKAVNAYRKLIK